MNIISNYPNDDNNIENDYRKGAGYYIPLTIIVACFLTGFILLAYLITIIPDTYDEIPTVKAEPIQQVYEVPEKKVEEKKPEPVVKLTDDDLIAMVVMHEAGNQELIGKVAVAMTVLNRCDYYGATVEQIVTAPNQYAYPYYGVITHECYRAIEIARENRDLFPSTMMWFLPTDYPKYGEPYMQIQGHYFNYLPDESEG